MALTSRPLFTPRRWPQLLALALLLGPTALAAADFLDAYKNGLKAIKGQDWAAAAGSLRAAIAGRSEEKERLPVRFYFEPYVPHYYLGVALFSAGDCPGALAAWAESERQGVGPKLPLWGEAEKGRATCRERQAEAARLEEARRQAEQRLREATASLDKLRGELSAAADAALDEAELGEIDSAAGSARGRLEELRRQVTNAAEARDGERLHSAAEAAAALAQRAAELSRQLSELGERSANAHTSASAQLAASLEAAAKALAALPQLSTLPPELARRKAEVEALVAAAKARPPGARTEDLAKLNSQLASATNRLRRASAPPPDKLQRAATAFLQGDLEQVVSALESVSFDDARTNAQAFLLRGAARYYLFVEGGETASSLLVAARADVRACHVADPERLPSARIFSPRFLAFFRQEIAALPSE